jgi:hypothetical protein
MGLFDRRRNVPEWKHEDPKVRRAAVGELSDPALLAEIARTDGDERVREEAVGVLHGLALEGQTDSALVALEARSAALESVSRAALERLDDPRALGSVARHGHHVPVCIAALEKISDPAELATVAQKSDHPDVALAALDRIASLYPPGQPGGISLEEILGPVAQRARNKSAAKRARAMLSAGRPEGAEAEEPRPATDRGRQTDLCDKMEALAASEGSSSLAAGISEVREAWIDLLPDVDDDLAERFSRALHAARERLARNQVELEERRKREQEEAEFTARNVTPRRELCEKLEATGADSAEAVLNEVRFEWERLGPLETEEGRALQQRFDTAVAACEARLRARTEEQASARRQAEQEAARQEKERLQSENRQRLEQICVRLERLLQAENVSLKALGRALKDVQAALDDPGPLPSRADHNVLEKRFRALQAGLAPRLREMKEREEWECWANTGVQEDLCLRAEALLQIDQPLEAARRLIQIQEQWSRASRASGDKAREIWERFRTARDEIRARAEAFRAEQAAKKEELCVKAEALADSTEWIRTATALQGLQAEWKNLGPSLPAQDKVLWERFRKACDAFFTRRKEDLKHRRQELSKNRDAKLALCAQAEAVADSTDWQATAAALKKLQVDWKGVGPVSRRESEILWQRFRGACDRFFDRYKHRGDIEREAHVAERVSLIREMEALLPAPAASLSEPVTAFPEPAPAAIPASPEVVSEASPSPVDAAPAGEPTVAQARPEAPRDLPQILRSAVERWKQCAPPPRDRAAELEERFRGAIDGLVLAYPEAVRGSAWDVSENIRKMEELCVQVEKLVTKEQMADDSAASPAARLTAMWVEAMAANTIGGGVKDDTNGRAAAEEVRRAQALWQRIGYVPGEPRRALTARFERTCRRILGHLEGDNPASTPKPGPPRR